MHCNYWTSKTIHLRICSYICTVYVVIQIWCILTLNKINYFLPKLQSINQLLIFHPDTCPSSTKFSEISVSSVHTWPNYWHLILERQHGHIVYQYIFWNQLIYQHCKPIFNKSIHSGLLPSAGRWSNVSPVYKGGDYNDPGILD